MPGRVDNAAERALSTLSGSLGAAGDAAWSAGATVRDRLRDSARALERGGRRLRTTGMKGAAAAATHRVRDNRNKVLGTLGALAGSLAVVALVRRARGRASRI